MNRAGAVQGTRSGKQHQDMYRKLLLRRQLLKHAAPGSVYLPFVGDGDIAVEVYAGRTVYAADIDPGRVATAAPRLTGAVVTANCDDWPFPTCEAPFAVADFDAYAHPYASFRAFWQEAVKTSPLILFFTDGHRQGVIRTGHWITPEGEHRYLELLTDRRLVFNFYLPRYVYPWFECAIAPWRCVRKLGYLRGMQCYWGAVIERP